LGEVVVTGLLALAGGAEFDERMAEADREWLRRLGVHPRLVVLPTANESRPDLAAANGVFHFQRLGADAESVLVTDAASANDPERLRPVESADCLYIAGGNPRYLFSVLYESLGWQTIERRWREGMALCGSSAGAMVLCQAVFLRDSWSDALALLPGAVCFPHFNNRDAASVEAVRLAVNRRGLVGLGIDESTVLYLWEGVWRVSGPGRLSVLSPDGVAVFSAGDPVLGVPQPIGG
jgi:cyanophycinase